MWKVLLVIAAVVLAGATYLSYVNMGAYQDVLAAITAQKELLVQREAGLKKTNDEITVLEQSIQALTTETQALQAKKVDLDNKVTETDSNHKAQQSALETAKADLDKAKVLIKDIAGIESIQKEMIQIRTQIEESEIELTQLEGTVAAAQVERDRLEKVAAELVALRADQESGMIRGEFQTTVKKAYNQWGFVVIAGGFDQGVVNRSQLDVYRRGQPICRLLVTSVDASESAADIVAGSLAPGQSVQPGDTVVKSMKVQTPAVVPASAPGAGAPTAPAAGGVAPTAPGGAPAASDPFGGMAPAAPAAPDPFGGGMAPAPGAAPATGTPPDPFGAPAPAPGGAAPAPGAAPATGTPPDPFGAPAPAPGGAAPAPGAAPATGTPPDPFGAPAPAPGGAAPAPPAQ
jgi:hypothetical protein